MYSVSFRVVSFRFVPQSLASTAIRVGSECAATLAAATLLLAWPAQAGIEEPRNPGIESL